MNDKHLDPKFVEWLSGNQLEEKQHDAMQLLTVSEEGWPHQAMISVGEIIAMNPDTLRLALWPGTQTSMNMNRTGKATLIAVHEHQLMYVRLEIVALPPLKEAIHPRDRYEAHVASVRVDRAPYADITTGITFQLKEEVASIARWKETIAELRQ